MKCLLALIVLLISSLPALAGRYVHPHVGFVKRQNITLAPQSIAAPNAGPYDYVVVGSGPGGGPLASRLAIAGYKVLLIEAGDDQGNATVQQVPAVMLQSTEYAPMRWDYFVNHYQDLSRQQQDSKLVWRTPSGDKFVGSNPPAGSTVLGILYPRAGTLGGCSAHNAMITIYPHESDWNNIASVTGDNTWQAGNMRKYFQRLEKCRYLPNGVAGHGFDGWYETSVTELSLVVQDSKILALITAAAKTANTLGGILGGLLGGLISTVTQLGQVLLSDINAYTPSRDSQEGLYQVPLAVQQIEKKRTGARDIVVATANAVNADGSRKYHLDVKLNTLVTKVRFDTTGSKPKAIGVDYLEGRSLYRADPGASLSDGGNTGSIDVTREVILSAGAFNTPQLLKLSGIGNQNELSSLGIPVVANLPGVGTNLQDRYETTVAGDSNTNFAITKDCTWLRTDADPCLKQWQTQPGPALKGVYASNGVAIAIVKKSSVAESDPDLLIAGAPVYFKGYYPGYSNDAVKDAHHWIWLVLKAHSRNNAGNVTLRSANPRDSPIINFNHFDTGNTANGAADKDVQASYEGMVFARQIFKNYFSLQDSFTEVWPGSQVNTEAQMKDFIRNEAWGHHASCTCPIGADQDPMAVLDSRFRVRGVSGLRVVDASVFPKIPGFFIVLPTYMVSEKAADVIVEDATKARI